MKKLTTKVRNFLLKKKQAVISYYHKAAQTPYGKLIRMESYWVYPMLFLPSWIAIWINTQDKYLEQIFVSIFFALGAFITRSLGCIINDLFDIKFDKEVERTKNRPIAKGVILPKDAVNFAIILGMLATILLVSLPTSSIIAGLIAGILIILYPLSKRFTFLPQVILGFTFNLGFILAWFTTQNNNFFAMILLYLAFVLFTIGYDTIYACQDLEDDKKIGVKSLPLLLEKKGISIKYFTGQLYRGSVGLLGLGGLLANLGLVFFLCLGLASYTLYLNFKKCDITKPTDCSDHFKSCADFLFLVFLGTW
jgi:4-hydroxybenzoate polyprenyltransferase